MFKSLLQKKERNDLFSVEERAEAMDFLFQQGQFGLDISRPLWPETARYRGYLLQRTGNLSPSRLEKHPSSMVQVSLAWVGYWTRWRLQESPKTAVKDCGMIAG